MIDQKTQEVLKNSKISNNTLKLPNVELSRDEYLLVKKVLTKIGGKWKGGKVSGFVFDFDPTDLVNRVLSGESINLKKDFQFFATPGTLAKRLVELAEIESDHSVLEPSAGQGAIIEAVNKVVGNTVFFCELMDQNLEVLEKKDLNCELLGRDFLKLDASDRKFDRIVANPPFSKNQDIDHVMHMYEFLEKGGVLVSVMSVSWQRGRQKKQKQFREWLDSVGFVVENLEPGTFKNSGTGVGSCVVKVFRRG